MQLGHIIVCPLLIKLISVLVLSKAFFMTSFGGMGLTHMSHISDLVLEIYVSVTIVHLCRETKEEYE